MKRRQYFAVISSGAVTAIAGCAGNQEQLEAQNETIERQEQRIEELEQQLAEKNETVAEYENIEVRYQNTREEVNELEAELRQARNNASHKADEIDSLEQRIDELEPKTNFTDEQQRQAREIGHEYRHAVVLMADDNYSGAGFHIGDGQYLTAQHIFSGPAISLSGPSLQTFGGQWYSMESLGSHSLADIELFESEHEDHVTVDIADGHSPTSGDVCVAIGHPQNVGVWVITVGRYVETIDDDGEQRHLVNMPTHQGNSGSPVLTLDGEFVGMLTHNQTNTSQELDRPDQPQYHFHGHDPMGLVLPAERIQELTALWTE